MRRITNETVQKLGIGKQNVFWLHIRRIKRQKHRTFDPPKDPLRLICSSATS